MAKSKKQEVTSVRGVSVKDLYTMLKEGKPFPEGVCRNFELDPPFFDCEEMEERVSAVDNHGFGLVVNKSVRSDEGEKEVVRVAEVRKADETNEPKSE